MATEIVTAKAGTNHVDSEDIGALYAGGFGKGRYALNLGNNLKCSMRDANTLVIDTGGIMFDGRFVRVKSAESLTVTNGTQSQYRKDLAVLTYKRDASNNNIESVSWSVLRGTPASSESAAKAPTFTEGSILDGDATAVVAVAEVDLAGLTPSCKLLLPKVTSLATLGDSVSHVEPHGEKDITFTPKVDCDVLVLCAVSGVWGYGGEAITMRVDCAQLEAVSKHAGKFSGGNTEAHQLTFWGVFRGAKAGVKYSFSISVNGNLQGKTEATSICMAVHL